MRLCRLLLVAVCFALGAAPATAQSPAVLVADISLENAADQILATSLQGVANSLPNGPMVYLVRGKTDRDWLAYCLRFSGQSATEVTVAALLDALRPSVNGQILYDPEAGYTLDIATTAAGIHRAIMSPTDLGLPTLLDLRDKWRSGSDAYQWAIDALLPKCTSNRLVAIPSGDLALRDFAIQQRMFTISSAGEEGGSHLERILSHLPAGSAIYGVVTESVRRTASYYFHYIVPATDAANLSFLSRPSSPENQHQYFTYIEPEADRYLTLIFDCADVGFAINQMPTLWEHSTRGRLPLGWALPGALPETAPMVLRRYYADAYRSGIDAFVVGPSGAGEFDCSAAAFPEPFMQATHRAEAALDAQTILLQAPSRPDGIEYPVSRFVEASGARGVFLLGSADFEPVIRSGVPVVATPRIATVQEAFRYLERVPLERRFVALYLDGRSLNPGDAAHIAARVSGRYVVVSPEELMAAARAFAVGPQHRDSNPVVTSVQYPEVTTPDSPVLIQALGQALEESSSLSVVYRPPGHRLAFSEPMTPAGDRYSAALPPLRCGGDFTVRIRAVSGQGRVAWSPEWTMRVPRSDSDGDGLSDAEEAYLLTDIALADTDQDGLLDGNDVYPLRHDAVPVTYFGPVTPPSDGPYLVADGGSQLRMAAEHDARQEGRLLLPGQSCLYSLPVHLLPPDVPAAVRVDAGGPVAIAIADGEGALTDSYTGHLNGAWYSGPVLSRKHPDGLLVRITCPTGDELRAASEGARQDAEAALIIHGLALVSPPGAPSVTDVSVRPGHPGPGYPIAMSALAYSPHEVIGVDISYRVNGEGVVRFPMQPVPGSQRYAARLPALRNRDQLEWWVSATDADGNLVSTPRMVLIIGSWSRETVGLLATRDFAGDWSTLPEGGRAAAAEGLVDSAYVNLTGGNYFVWVFGGGRGRGVAVQARGNQVGIVDPDLPDGWQMVGRTRLDVGRHQIDLVSLPCPEGTSVASRYTSVIMTADSTFVPPPNQPIDVYNSLVLIFPPPGYALTGFVELQATGAGNLTAVEFFLDGQFLRRVSGPPFTARLSTGRLENGPHTLRIEGLDRAGPTGLAVEIPVTIENAASSRPGLP